MVGLGWARSTINKAVNRIKLCFIWAASEELVPPEVSMGLKTVAGLKKNRTAAKEKEPVAPVSDEQIEATLPHVPPLVADAIRVMRYTGARPGEILSMRADQIDRTDPTLWRYRPGHHKNEHRDRTRIVFLGSRAQQVLVPYLLKAGNKSLFPITLSAFRRVIVRACKAAGIRRWAPNMIRHCVGTAVRAAYGLEGAQVLLGHSRCDVTQTYAQRDLRQAAEIARKIG
jgi:integrase